MAAPAFSEEFMRVQVPFEFSIGSKAYPAGDYVVSSRDLITYRISSGNAQKSASIVTEQMDSPIKSHSASLVFVNVAGQYHLMEIWYDRHLGHASPEASSLRKQIIASTPKVQVLASVR
jgi:hypothetical protein